MPRYKLRTLLIVLARGPPVLAGALLAINQGWLRYALPALIILMAFGLAYVAERFAAFVTRK